HKYILHGITGSVAPGEILAMMGPSGSGKTTLLKILGGRLLRDVSGSVTFNDVPYGSFMKKRIGFVAQEDILFPYLTVQECLEFTALLRLPNTMTRSQKMSKADRVLKDLGLERCRHTIIGGPFIPGVSGGERKRTSIGSEILIDPSLLLLDEPTSGLDSATALKILQVVGNIAQAGRTILTTIHQPSSRLFHMFDKLILISEGHTIYSGPAREVMSYFSSLHFVPEITMNPADFLLDLAVGVVHDISIPEDITNRSPEEEKLDNAGARHLRMKYKTELEPKEKQKICTLKVSNNLKEMIQAKHDFSSSWPLQFKVLFKRTFKERARDYFDYIRFIQVIGVSIVLGLLWWQSKLDTEIDVRDQAGLIFYIAIFWSTSGLFSSVSTFPLERPFLIKELGADMYSLSAFYASSTISDIIAEIIYPTIFVIIVYFMTGLHRSLESFMLTLLSTYLLTVASQGAGDLLGAAVMDVKKSGTVASLVLLLFLLVGGYYVQHMPVFMKWIKYVSFIFYGYRLLLKTQYSPEQKYDCKDARGCQRLGTSSAFYGVDLNGGVKEACILIAMAILYRVSAYMFLRRIRTSF
ncbi:hypothetical protein SELMODRAFT_136119, partial [Selaginella moellendorffii]